MTDLDKLKESAARWRTENPNVNEWPVSVEVLLDRALMTR